MGPALGQIHRENQEEMSRYIHFYPIFLSKTYALRISIMYILAFLLFYRLYEYQFDDFKFLHERRPNQTDDLCGPNRKCRDGYFSVSDNPWEWSANRVMAPRLAFRMRRLAIIAKDIAGLQGSQKSYLMVLHR